MNKLETHNYDGRLSKVITTKKNISEKEFEIFIKCLVEINTFLKLDSFFNTESKINAKKSIHLLANDRANNYDEKNRIHVELLLPIIWNKVKKHNDSTIYQAFIEQISDIMNGSCPQGRTTRLIQLLLI